MEEGVRAIDLFEMGNEKIEFSADRPVDNRHHDRFQRYNFSKRIAETIIKRNSTDGIVIGIYGAWGEGKTSVLNFIERELSHDPGIIILKLNPWRYNNEESLLLNFFRKISSVLQRELDTRKEKFGNFLSKYGSAGSFLGADVSQLGRSIADVDLEELKSRADDFIKESGNKLVIVVDDIDRLDKEELYSLFRLVKLTADFSNTTYILAFDEQMVASAIADRFANDKRSGENFLEKIVQVPLKIPKAQSEALQKYCFELINKALDESAIQLTKDDSQKFISQFSESVVLRLKTPRMAVRYGNTLSFSLPLLKGEVNYIDLMLIEAVKIFYPAHYEFIKNNGHYFLTSYSSNNGEKEKKPELEEQLSRLGNELTKDEARAILSLLKYLFPRLKEAFQNVFEHQGEIKWYRLKRIGSLHYFKRYFSYTVIEGEISDIVFEDFISTVKDAAGDKIKEKMEVMMSQASPDSFIIKLESAGFNLNWETIKSVALAVSSYSDKFNNNGSLFGFGYDSEKGKAAMVVFRMVRRHQNKDESFEFAKQLMEAPVPFEFSYKLCDWFTSGESEGDLPFSTEQINLLAEILRNRAINSANGVPLFIEFPEYIIFLFKSWKASAPKDLEGYLRTILQQDPIKVQDLLFAFTPTASSTSHPQPHKIDFTQEQYNFTITLVDKELLHDSVAYAFGDEIGSSEAIFNDRNPVQTHLNIVRQFEHWYNLDKVNKGEELAE